MLRKVRMLTAALALVGASVASSQAVDLCFDYSAGGSVVAKRFKIPTRNKCAPFNGVERVNEGGALTGSGCTNAAGDWLIINYSFHDHRINTSYFEAATCRVPLSIQPGGNPGICQGTYLATPGGSGRFNQYAQFYYCNVDVPD